ncbi:hypothetical protein WA026_015777 [Henosepilachna vigintioctopunctata]|uniref:Uncharacterized protein n=1 Tax=Henosepilachna vigintioctopunctata TaxID=420089 RepID=A0AAW1UZF4_9CUCU
MQKRLQIPTLQTGLRDSITAILNMPGISISASTHETDQREDTVNLPIAKKGKFVQFAPPQSEEENEKELLHQVQKIHVWRAQT